MTFFILRSVVVSMVSGQTRSLLDGSRLALQFVGLLLLLAALWPGTLLAATTSALQICVSDSPFPPFSHPIQEAEGQRVVRQAVERQGGTVEFVSQPWRRCLFGVQQGAYAGLVGTAATLEYRSFLAFPRLDGAIDTRRSLGATTLVVYRRVGSHGSWDGRDFQDMDGPVLYLSGRSALKHVFVKKHVESLDYARNSQQLALMLLNGRGSLAIDHQLDVQRITRMAEFQGQFEILPTPFGNADIYFAVGLDTYRQQRQLYEAIWSDIAVLRAEAPTLGPQFRDTVPR